MQKNWREQRIIKQGFKELGQHSSSILLLFLCFGIATWLLGAQYNSSYVSAQQQEFVVTSVKITQEFSKSRVFTQIDVFILNTIAKDQSYSIKITGGQIQKNTVTAIINQRIITYHLDYQENTSQNILTLLLLKSQIPVNEEVKLEITFFRVFPEFTGQARIFTDSWDFQTKVTTIKYVNVFPKSFTLQESSPAPNTVYRQEQYTQVTWVGFNNKTMQVKITLTYQDNIVFQPFAILPQAILVMGEKHQQETLTIQIKNQYFKDLDILIMSNNTSVLQLANTTLSLEFNKTSILKFKVMIPKVQETVSIIISTKLAIPYTSIALIYFKPMNSESQVQLTSKQVIALLLISSITGLAVFFILKPPSRVIHWYQRVKHKLVIQESKNKIEQTSRALLSPAGSKELEIAVLKAIDLDENEKRIIVYLFSHNRVVQQRIAEHLELSKATVSRTLGKLERKGFIQREKIGMSNKVVLDYEALTHAFIGSYEV